MLCSYARKLVTNTDSKMKFNEDNSCTFWCSCEHTRLCGEERVTEWLSLWLVPTAEGKATIANYLSLYTTAALVIWMSQCEPVRMSVCVTVTKWRDWQIASCLSRRTEKVWCRRDGGEVCGREAKHVAQIWKGAKSDRWLDLTFVAKMNSWGTRRPLLSRPLMTDPVTKAQLMPQKRSMCEQNTGRAATTTCHHCEPLHYHVFLMHNSVISQLRGL